MHGQHFAKVNNKSLGFVNEFKTKAVSRYMNETITPASKRLFLNPQACRKPSTKAHSPGEPCKPSAFSWDLCPAREPHQAHMEQLCAGRGLLVLPGGYQLPEKGFPPRALFSPLTHLAKDPKRTPLWQPLQKSPVPPPPISRQPGPADGCSRGKAIDLNILEGSRPLASAR